jgi:hypothetical protein
MNHQHTLKPKLLRTHRVLPMITAAVLGVGLIGTSTPVTAAPTAKDFQLAITPNQISVQAGQSVSITAQVLWGKNGIGARPTYRLSHTLKGAQLSLQQGSTNGVTIMIVTNVKTPLQQKSLTVIAKSAGKTRKFTALIAVTQPAAAVAQNPVPTAPPATAGPTLAPAPAPTATPTAAPTAPPTTVATTTSTTTTTTTTKLVALPFTGGKKFPVTDLFDSARVSATGLSARVVVASKRQSRVEVEVGFGPTMGNYTYVFQEASRVAHIESNTLGGTVDLTIQGLKPATQYSMIVRAYDSSRSVQTQLLTFTTKRRVVKVTGQWLNLVDDSDGTGSGEMTFIMGAGGKWYLNDGTYQNFDLSSGSIVLGFASINVDYQGSDPLSLAFFARDCDQTVRLCLSGTGPTENYNQRVGESEPALENDDDVAMAAANINVLPANPDAPESFDDLLNLDSHNYDVKFEVVYHYWVTYV